MCNCMLTPRSALRAAHSQLHCDSSLQGKAAAAAAAASAATNAAAAAALGLLTTRRWGTPCPCAGL
jgi:hypothetical protein